jgi:hypothetical protein
MFYLGDDGIAKETLFYLSGGTFAAAFFVLGIPEHWTPALLFPATG